MWNLFGKMASGAALVMALAAMLLAPGAALARGGVPPPYDQVIQRVISMPHDQALQQRLRRIGLNAVNVTWEDTGRSQGSALGPNISDMTLQVRQPLYQAGSKQLRTHMLPVIRYPNFSDKTADIAANKLWVRVGNQRHGGQVTEVPLTTVLANIKPFLSDPSSLPGNGSFLSARDSHFLLSAQHVFVPLPAGGKAEFNPVLFNYQSAPGSPAVLTLLISRQGTSATIIDNRGGDISYQGWGQQLFFNNAGQKTVFTAERRSDVKARIESGHATEQDQGALEAGADMVMVVQVPLKHQNRGHLSGIGSGGMAYDMAPSAAAPSMAESAPMEKSARRGAGPASDVEKAVIGHGDDEGHFSEMGHMRLERDERFPVRVTVQFYRATSNGVVSDQDLNEVKALIDRVYADGDFVGSLVTGSQNRPTAIKPPPPEPESWNPWRQVYVQ